LVGTGFPVRYKFKILVSSQVLAFSDLCDCTCNIPPPWEHSPRELACILGKYISAKEKEEIRGFKIEK